MNRIYFGTFAFIICLFLTLQASVLQNFSLLLAFGTTMASLIIAIACKNSQWRNLFFVLFFAFLGLCNGLCVGTSAEEHLQPYFGKDVIMEGYVEPLSVKLGTNYTSFLLKCERLQHGSKVITYEGKVRLTLSQAEFQSLLPRAVNNPQGKIIVYGKLEKLIGFRNPGGFNSQLYNRINDIGGRLSRAHFLKSVPQDKNKEALLFSIQSKLAQWNIALRQKLQQNMGERAGKLLGSMLLGDSSTVDEYTRELFTANGLSHLLSVSGTHLLLLASLLSLLLKPLPKAWRNFIMVVLLALYTALCGLRPPVLRAFLMSSAVLLGHMQNDAENTLSERQQRLARSDGKQMERGILLCIVAIILLLFKPLWLLDIGFQLSFAAAAGLLWLMPACQRALNIFLPEFLAEGLAITLAAQLGTLPIILANFHHISSIAFLSNLVLVPVLEVAALLCVFGACIKIISLEVFMWIGSGFMGVGSFLIEQLLTQAELLSKLPLSQLVIGSLPLWCAVVYYAALLVWADVPMLQFLRNRERKGILFVASLLLSSALLWQNYSPRPLMVYFLDVSQGDCVAIMTPSRKIYIYDTGGLQGLDTGKRIIAPFVHSLGKNEVEALILSHYDYDHVGGAVGVLQQLRVREIVLPRERLAADSRALHEGITSAAYSRGTKISVAEQGRSWELGAGMVMNLLTPDTILSDNKAGIGMREALLASTEADDNFGVQQADARATGNEASTILSLRSPMGSLLLTGDLSSEGEEDLPIEECTVFKAGHHGSKYSNSEAFLQRLRPQICVISCGSNNRYGHPHQETLERLQNAGIQVFRTDLQGCIKVVFDENGLKCYSYVYDGF